MRDGVKLFTIVYAPKDQSQTYPFMLHRTPYGSPPYGPDAYRRDARAVGGFREGGVHLRLPGRAREVPIGRRVRRHAADSCRRRRGPKDTDESTDTYDTIDWLVKNVPNNNGRVGQWGISYPGSQTVWGMIDAHPGAQGVVAAGAGDRHVPRRRLPSQRRVPPDVHVQLAGRQRAAARRRRRETRGPAFNYGTPDGYRFFLDAGPVANINEKYFNYSVPTWNEYMEHPDYDEYWERQNPLKHLKNVTHAVLNVAGWFDAEDFYGPLETYRDDREGHPDERRTPSSSARGCTAAGPRCRATRSATSSSARRPASTTGSNVELPFFLHHLKDKGADDRPKRSSSRPAATSGRRSTRGRRAAPSRARSTSRRMARCRLRRRRTSAADAFDEFISDPAKPVPFSAETRTTQGHLWMVEDQRFAAVAAGRARLSDRAARPRTSSIAGPIIASLFVSTTGTDADWIVKLIDVYPGTAPDNHAEPARHPHGPLPDAARRRSVPQQVPELVLEARAAGAERADEDRVRSARSVPPVPERPPHHGAGAELLVPGDRSQSADVREHLQGAESDFKKATHRVHRSARCRQA